VARQGRDRDKPASTIGCAVKPYSAAGAYSVHHHEADRTGSTDSMPSANTGSMDSTGEFLNWLAPCVVGLLL